MLKSQINTTSKPRIPMAWVAGKTEEEKARVVDLVLGSSMVLGILRKIVEDKIAELDQTEISTTAYDNPSWAYKQAHINGAKKSLKDMLLLIPNEG